MEGLIMTFKGKVYKIGIPGSKVSVIANIKENDSWMNAGGCRMPEENLLDWMAAELNEGDEIELEIADIDEASEPLSEENFHGMMKKYSEKIDAEGPDWEGKLEEFYRLEKVLEEEGWME